MEELWPEFSVDPLARDTTRFNAKWADPEVRHAVSTTLLQQRAAKSAYKVTTMAKALGKQMHSHRAADDSKAAARYFLSCRFAFSKAWHIAVATDAGRSSGKEWLFSALMDQSGSFTSAWLPPTVPLLAIVDMKQ